jgi:hypothetical protein
MTFKELLAVGKKWMTSRPFSITGRSTITFGNASRSVSLWNMTDFLASRADSAPLTIQASDRLECDIVDTLDTLLLPDVMSMATRAAYIIQHQSSRHSLLALKGDDAQAFIDLFHAVHLTFLDPVGDCTHFFSIATGLLSV